MAEIKLASENAIIIYFGDDISPFVIKKIAFYDQLLRQNLAEFIIDTIPSYTSLMVSYRLSLIHHHEFTRRVEALLSTTCPRTLSYLYETSEIELPVYYDNEVGLDLANVLEKKQLTLAQFIEMHTADVYHIYAIGFCPAFAFLGTLNPRIQLPRLPTPRPHVSRGSVAIADNQTAIYPIDSAAGWNVVGRTPVDLSLSDKINLERFKVGGCVKFTAIDRQQFLSLGGQL